MMKGKGPVPEENIHTIEVKDQFGMKHSKYFKTISLENAPAHANQILRVPTSQKPDHLPQSSGNLGVDAVVCKLSDAEQD